MSKPSRPITAVLGCVILLGTTAALAADWPQWRGPKRNGISEEVGLLEEWPKEGPRLVWQVKGGVADTRRPLSWVTASTCSGTRVSRRSP